MNKLTIHLLLWIITVSLPAFSQNSSGALSESNGYYGPHIELEIIQEFSASLLVDVPANIELMSSGSMVILDQSTKLISHVDIKGRLLKQWGGEGFSKGKFSQPQGLAINHKDQIYVGDFARAWIDIFNTKGDLVGGFNDVFGVLHMSISPNGLVYMSRGDLPYRDDEPKKIFSVFSPEGRILEFVYDDELIKQQPYLSKSGFLRPLFATNSLFLVSTVQPLLVEYDYEYTLLSTFVINDPRYEVSWQREEANIPGKRLYRSAKYHDGNIFLLCINPSGLEILRITTTGKIKCRYYLETDQRALRATDFAILSKDGESMKLAVVTHEPQPSLIFLQPKELVKQ